MDNTPSIEIAPEEKVVNCTKLSSSFIALLAIVPMLIFPLAVAEVAIDVMIAMMIVYMLQQILVPQEPLH